MCSYVCVCLCMYICTSHTWNGPVFPSVPTCNCARKTRLLLEASSQCGNFPLWGVAEPNLTYCPLPLTLQRVAQLVGANESGSFALGVNVRQIGSHAGRVHNIVQGELRDQGVLLEQQRQGLTNAASGAANGHLVVILQKNMYKFNIYTYSSWVVQLPVELRVNRKSSDQNCCWVCFEFLFIT